MNFFKNFTNFFSSFFPLSNLFLEIQTEAPHDVLPQSPSPAAGSAANVTAAPPTATITTKSTKEIEETEKDKNESVITK